MGRKIKFRAWIKDEEKMLQFHEIIFHEYTDIQEHFEDDELIFMQFTGRTDANGVEIYEGDVFEGEEHFYAQVYWCKKSLSWMADGEGLADFSGISIKVIGNIYENPELLEQANETH